jgi:hypothetical protein
MESVGCIIAGGQPARTEILVEIVRSVMRRIVEILLSSFLVMTALFGQQAGVPKKNTPASSGVDRKEVEALRGEIAILRKQIESLREQVTSLQNNMASNSLDVYKLKHEVAEFDPSSPGPYERVDTSVGPLLVSIGKVEPYLDGYKVGLEIGNPLSVTFNGFDIQAAWGPRYKIGQNYAKWLVARQEKKISLTDRLSPGRWTPIEIILPSTESKDFGYLSIQLTVNNLSFVYQVP